MPERFFGMNARALAAGLVLALAGMGWAEPRPLSLRVIQSGHSLTDPIPDPLRAMVRAGGHRGAVIDGSTIPGSPMDWRWDNPPGYGKPDARGDIGNYDVLVLTERVSLSGTLPWHDSEAEALRWFSHAWSEGNGGKGAETVLYATWVDIAPAPGAGGDDPERHIPFRDRLPLEMARWEAIRDHVNANRPAGSPPMRMIPGPLLMAALHDAIEAGQAPGLSDISDVFLDHIHLNDLGAYYIALAHYAVIYNRDPRGLPDRLGLASPPAELAAWMQEMVWSVVTGYEGSGVGG